jgi:hypothetical protein
LATVGEPLAVPGGVAAISAGDRLILEGRRGHSYVCEGVPSQVDSEFSLSQTVEGLEEESSIESRFIGQMIPPITGGTARQTTTRISFTAPGIDRYAVSVASAVSEGENVRARCIDTTKFGGFNTFANPFNFLEIRNVSNQRISGMITLRDHSGTVIVEGLSFSAKPLQRIDVDLHSLVGANNFGLIKVSHDGAFGAVHGRVSEYSVNAGRLVLRGSHRLKNAKN